MNPSFCRWVDVFLIEEVVNGSGEFQAVDNLTGEQRRVDDRVTGDIATRVAFGSRARTLGVGLNEYVEMVLGGPRYSEVAFEG